MNVLIVAGEASGDLYGGQLASHLHQRLPGLVLSGMGGDQMREAGVEILYHHHAVSVVGVFEVFSKLQHLNDASRRLKRWILQNKPAFAILIDFPDFNFRLARFLRLHKIPIVYYVSPQLWAWRKNRIHFLKDHVDLMISILPFEEALYREVGVPVVYTGHPLVEMVSREVAGQPIYQKKDKPLIGIMPGSRDVEVRRHLPILEEAVSLMRKQMDVDTLMICAPSIRYDQYSVDSVVQQVKENRYAAMKACDLLLVASGTSTLEAAILGTPLFIVYKVGGLSWQLGKFLVRVPYYGLVNWIAGEKLIPEYIQNRMNPELLARDALAFLKDQVAGDRMRQDLMRIVESLGPPGAIERAVDAILTRFPESK